jgi:hypothetical protein
MIANGMERYRRSREPKVEKSLEPDVLIGVFYRRMSKKTSSSPGLQQAIKVLWTDT